ncbi:H-NS family nucleoid-associated regulatory protein [Janthinobacterium sp. SUN128]|uniref:H-NS family nucleoid-associated regulatory protein n=1 Tax=Janthinobacterium sp. SUN128 TaxID=3014790 RepID=UPI002712DEEB|nr:H-NS family nucleoid-associated regulatory protein [Janthinobacterium sp. SUN128]MDO8033554.1 H-NS family nucleoid-associated regulatory protein [Janthinobacterium sp. SUN128]
MVTIQLPLREIARRLGISRNTVRRYLRSETIEPAYAERRSSRAIDKYAFQLSAFLKTEAAKSRKQRRTLKQIHEDLKELGFEGSYDRVAAFARVWREGQTERVNPASKRTEKKAVAALYRNPDNQEQQWSGRGRQPLWVKSWLEKHQSLDGVRI